MDLLNHFIYTDRRDLESTNDRLKWCRSRGYADPVTACTAPHDTKSSDGAVPGGSLKRSLTHQWKVGKCRWFVGGSSSVVIDKIQ